MINDKISQEIKEDKKLQKIIWKEYLKSFDMCVSYGILGTVLFLNIFFIAINPKIFIPVTVIAVIIELIVMFKKKYSLDIYEVKEIGKNFKEDKYLYCVITKPGNKNVTGYLEGSIIKEKNENIKINDKVIGITVGDKILVVKPKEN
jgi:hypothetical protein